MDMPNGCVRPKGPCPRLRAARKTMLIPGAQQRTYPTDAGRPEGHAHSLSRPVEIKEIGPILTPTDGHAQRLRSPHGPCPRLRAAPRDMPIPGAQQRTYPTDAGRPKGHAH